MSARRLVAFAWVACIAWTACSTEDPAAVPEGTIDGIPTGNPNGLVDGADCTKNFDCKSGICTATKCAIPSSTDGVRNGGETGLDCGGPAPPCPAGQPCNGGGDCIAGDCREGKCTDGPPATSSDGKKNGDESDVDCGGKSTNAPKCADGKGCAGPDDCESEVCSGATCAAPSATDKVQNGDETDVDCGGKSTNAPPCAVGKTCVAHADCASDGCDDLKKCVARRSCAMLNGGRTCGSGETGAAGAQHESCCESLPIPGQATLLDKYKVTAGRMRTFIERVNGDVQGWYNANKANLDPKAVAQINPWVSRLPVDLTKSSEPIGANYQLGSFVFHADRPSTSQGCYVGNAGNQGYGSHTYWTGALEGEDRGFDQALLDQLALNCTPEPLMAAFCAWDGGRLQTWEENSAAYGGGKYPWGNAPEACGINYEAGGQTWGFAGMASPPNTTYTAGPQPGCSTTRLNWLTNYQHPAGGNGAKPWDYAYWISPPGRFTADVGAGGHMDLGGVMMELTASPGPTPDPAYGPTVRWSRAGSWEGHQVNYHLWAFAVLTKYGKTGGRCARN